MDTFERLRSAAELTENDRAILAYVLDHPEEIAGLSTRDLAERTHTSASAVSRCCQRLGFPSFSVFKANIASDLKAADPGSISITSNERAVSAIAKTASLYDAIVSDMRQSVSADELQRVATLIEDAPYVGIVALTSNAICARYAEINLLLAGHIAKVFDDTESISRFSLMAPRDVPTILISRGGKSKPLVVAAQNLRRRRVQTVAITSDASSPLAQACHHVLTGYASLQDNLSYAAWNCSVSFVVDTLTSMLYSRHIRANQDNSEEHYTQYLDNIGTGEVTDTSQGNYIGDVDDMWYRAAERDGRT